MSSGAMVVMTLAFQKGDYHSSQVLRGGCFGCYLKSCFLAISAFFFPCVGEGGHTMLKRVVAVARKLVVDCPNCGLVDVKLSLIAFFLADLE